MGWTWLPASGLKMQECTYKIQGPGFQPRKVSRTRRFPAGKRPWGWSASLSRETHYVCQTQIFSVPFSRWNSLFLIQPSVSWKPLRKGKRRRAAAVATMFTLSWWPQSLVEWPSVNCLFVLGNEDRNVEAFSKAHNTASGKFWLIFAWRFGIGFLFMPDGGSLVWYFIFLTIIWDISAW